MADLVRLLNLSFTQWGVDAHAAPIDGDAGVAARVDAAGRPALTMRRGTDGGRGGWELTVGPAVRHEAIRSVSGVLLAVRRHLDPGFVPGRALIGVRPLAVPP